MSDFQTVGEGAQAVAQRLSIRLKMYFREWVLDRSAGTKWYQNILVKGSDKYVVDQELKKRVRDTEGVSDIRTWNSRFNASTREYELDFVVVTEIEEISLKFNLPV
jgi:hypothetical protein